MIVDISIFPSSSTYLAFHIEDHIRYLEIQNYIFPVNLTFDHYKKSLKCCLPSSLFCPICLQLYQLSFGQLLHGMYDLAFRIQLFSVFLCFHDPYLYGEYQLGILQNCASIWVCLIFSIWGKNSTEGKCPSDHMTSGDYIISAQPITDDVNLDHLIKVLFIRFLYCKVTVFLLSIFCYLEASHKVEGNMEKN